MYWKWNSWYSDPVAILHYQHEATSRMYLKHPCVASAVCRVIVVLEGEPLAQSQVLRIRFSWSFQPTVSILTVPAFCWLELLGRMSCLWFALKMMLSVLTCLFVKRGFLDTLAQTACTQCIWGSLISLTKNLWRVQNSATDSYPQICGLIRFWGPLVWSEPTTESDSGQEQVYPSCGLSSLLKSNMILLIQSMCCSRLDRQGCGWHLSVVGWIMQGGGTFLRCPLVQMYLRGQVSLRRAQHFAFFD